MAIRFQDRSHIASFLKDEFRDTILDVFRSHRAGLEKDEDRQFSEESFIAKENFDHIKEEIRNLNLATSTPQDFINIRKI